MKYRIILGKSKDKPYKLIQDPDGDNKTIGSYKTIQAAKEKLRHVVCKEN